MDPPFDGAFNASALPPPLPHLRRPVGFTAHVAAFFFDGFALFALAFFGGLAYALASEILPAVRSVPDFAIVLCEAAGIFLCTIGDVLFEASPGKWVFGLAIRTAAGEPAPRGRLVLRWLLKYGPLLLLFAYALIEMLGPAVGLAGTAFFDWALRACEEGATYWAWAIVVGTFLALLPARRTLHDLLAGTAVYSVPVRRSEFEAATLRRGFEVTPVPAATPAPSPSDSPS